MTDDPCDAWDEGNFRRHHWTQYAFGDVGWSLQHSMNDPDFPAAFQEEIDARLWGTADRVVQPIVIDNCRLSYPALRDPFQTLDRMHRVAAPDRLVLVIDYADIEARMMSEGIVSTIHHAGMFDHLRSLHLKPQKPTTKQNGRSAAYLSHDKTKKWR